MLERPRRRAPRRVGGDGETEVFCADEQSAVPMDTSRWRMLAADVLRAEGVRGAAELSVLFVERDAIAEMNRIHMDKEGPTDVLAFPIDAHDDLRTPGPTQSSAAPHPRRVDVGDLPLLLGDVVVCPSVAMEQAPRHAGTFDDEIALLVTHGILHVLGYDHDNEVNASAMRTREKALLEDLYWRAPAPALFDQGY